MPRAYSPPIQVAPEFEPLTLSLIDRREIARTLGLNVLSDDLAGCIGHLLGVYAATKHGARDTTKAATLSTLARIAGRGRGYRQHIARLADDRAGVDYTTHGLLQQLAADVLAGEVGAEVRLLAAADERARDLAEHERVEPSTEMLKFFCGNLRVVFNAAAAPHVEHTWANCRAFALEVFTVGGLVEELPDFDSHPDRLDRYLGTDVSTD